MRTNPYLRNMLALVFLGLCLAGCATAAPEGPSMERDHGGGGGGNGGGGSY